MVKYVQSCLYLLFCPTDLNVCFYDSTMILFYFFKKITISLRYSMESDRVIPPAFLLLRLLVFFFLRQDLIVYSLLVWNSRIGIYQAGLELIDICLLLPPEC